MPKPEPHFLRDLKITRVDLVPSGANIDETGDGSHVMLWKSAPDAEESITEKLIAKLTSLLKKESTMPETKKLEEMTPEELLKAAQDQATKLEEATTAATKLQGEHDELTKGFKTLTEKVEALTKDPDKDPEVVKEELRKAAEAKALEALPENVQAVLKAQAEVAEARIAKAEERATEAEKIAKAEQEARVVKESEVAAVALKGVPGTKEEIGKMLRAVDGLGKEVAEPIRKALETMSELVIQSPLFKALGRRSEEDDETPMGRLAKVAEEIRKADPKLTVEQALAQATVDNPKLAEEVREQS